jgi:hypothetical protein
MFEWIEFIKKDITHENEVELINNAYDLYEKLSQEDKDKIDSEFIKYRDDSISKREAIYPYYQFLINKLCL